MPISVTATSHQHILQKPHQYCDFCRKTVAEGARLSWWGSSSVIVCEEVSCYNSALESWNAHVAEINEEYDDN